MRSKSEGIGGVDEFERLAVAGKNSPLYRLDPRAKLLLTLFAVGIAASYPRYAVAAIIPLFLLPVFWLSLSEVSLRFLGGKLLLAFPFVFFVAIFNPLLDRAPVMELASIWISGGWLSFFSILLRFIFSVTLLLLLVASTGFNPLCAALLRLKVPPIFVVQLLLLYRYIFLLGEEVQRVRQAYALRALGDERMPLKVAGSLLGHLLLRVLARGQRIHQAMLCRGFDGDLSLRCPFQWRWGDTIFLLAWAAWLILARLVTIPDLLGRLFLEGLT